jgi:hypothetical protein
MSNDLPIPSNEELAMEWVDQHARSSVEGQHGDAALYSTACTLYHGFDLREGCINALRHYNATRCSPPWQEHRLEYKIKQAASTVPKHAPGGLARWMLRKKGLLVRYERRQQADGRAAVAAEPAATPVKRLAFDVDALEREVADVRTKIDYRWLMSRSPVPVESCTTVQFLEHLYQPGERVLIFTTFASQGQFIQWVGKCGVRLGMKPGLRGVKSELPAAAPEGVWFLSNPVSGEWKPNPRVTDNHGRPKMSRRSEEVVTRWPYLVLESDSAPEDLWLKFLVKLPLPIAAIYTSGGRSIHALVKLDASSKAWWDKYKSLIAPLFSKLGADPAALTAVRLTRLPGCRRGERLQKLLYLNPQPEMDGLPIINGGNKPCA